MYISLKELNKLNNMKTGCRLKSKKYWHLDIKRLMNINEAPEFNPLGC